MPEAIDSAAKRTKLAPRKNPYWQGISGGRGGLSLGYRKPSAGAGSWIAKIVIERARTEERLGSADDGAAASSGVSYAAALAMTLEWGKRQVAAIEAARHAEKHIAAPTVRSAVTAYMKVRSDRPGVSSNANWLKAHVLKNGRAFADIRLARLTAKSILDWRAALPKSLAASTKNRLLNDLRAALNAAVMLHRRELPAHTLSEIKVGTLSEPSNTEPRRQLLSDEQVVALVNAAFEVDSDEDFGRVVLVAAATGARFSQCAKLIVADVQVDKSRIMVPSSQKGRGKSTGKRVPVPVQPNVIERLRPVIDGRAGHEPLLMRWGYTEGQATRWQKSNREKWYQPYQVRQEWEAAVGLAAKTAGVPEDTVMYALRHSSIVRGLLKGLPVRLVAALHDTSVLMIERHYAAYITDLSEDMCRGAAISIAA